MVQQQKDKKKKGDEQQPEEMKRPGSAVSREFQPNRQQKAATIWRKQQEEQQSKTQKQQQQIYGFVPFKGAVVANPAALAPIYGTAIRQSNPLASSQQQQQQIHHVPTTNDYLHSIYAPPQLFRQQQQHRPPPHQPTADSSLMASSGNNGTRGVAQIQHQPPPVNNNGGGGMVAQHYHHQQQQSNGGIGGNVAAASSRPGSDLGMYKMMSAHSRCQSYTTLPRPEHGGPELFEEITAHPFSKSQQQQLYGNAREMNGNVPSGVVNQIPFRPPSFVSTSRSVGRKNSVAPSLPPAYFGGRQSNIFGNSINGGIGGNIEAFDIAEFGIEHAGGMHKELVPWNTISLSSWLTIVFGAAIFCLGAVRLYWRADFAKGQELFYGISAISSGLVGFFASQNRSFCMFVAAFLLCSINVVFIFVPFLSGILPLVPLLSAQSKPHISLGGTKEPVEVDIGLAVLSLMQLASAFSMLLYGCRAFGATMKHVDQQLRIANCTTNDGTTSSLVQQMMLMKQQQQKQKQQNSKGGGGGDSASGVLRNATTAGPGKF